MHLSSISATFASNAFIASPCSSSPSFPSSFLSSSLSDATSFSLSSPSDAICSRSVSSASSLCFRAVSASCSDARSCVISSDAASKSSQRDCDAANAASDSVFASRSFPASASKLSERVVVSARSFFTAVSWSWSADTRESSELRWADTDSRKLCSYG